MQHVILVLSSRPPLDPRHDRMFFTWRWAAACMPFTVAATSRIRGRMSGPTYPQSE